MAKLRVSVEHQEAMHRGVRPGLPHLLHDPEGIRVPGDVETKNLAPLVADDEKTVQHTKGDCRNGEEVHGGNRLPMVPQKRQPAFDGI